MGLPRLLRGVNSKSTVCAARFQLLCEMFASIVVRSSPFPTRLNSATNVDRRASNHSRLFARASVFFPVNNQMPQATWIDSQGIAHILERERSVASIMEKPEPRFPEFLLSFSLTRFEITLKTSQRIGKDAAHKAHDRLD